MGWTGIRNVLSVGVAGMVTILANGMELTLVEALQLSLERHPDAETARARLQELEAMEVTAASASYPYLSARINYVQTNNPMQGFGTILSQGTFDNTIDFNDPGQLDALTGQLEARYRVYSGGARDANRTIARHKRTAGEHYVEAAESALEDAVVSTYFSIRQADDIVRSVEAGINVLEENLRISKIKEESGELIRTERLNLEVELAALNRELLAQQHQARMARIRMAFLVSEPATTEISLADSDPSIERIAYPSSLGIKSRPEYLAAVEAAEAAAQGILSARAGKRPTMDAYASWQADKGWRREGDGASWTAGLVMNMPIFDGHRAKSEINAAKAREKATLEQVHRTELSLQMELEEARLAHQLAIAQKNVAAKQVDQAIEAAELSRERFAAGTLLSTELIGVESRLIDSRVQLAIATSQERMALAHLRRVSGHRILN